MSVSSIGDNLKQQQQRTDGSQSHYMPINKWPLKMVLEWLQRKMPSAFEAYANKFIENQITGETLLDFNDDCLDCLSIYDTRLRLSLLLLGVLILYVLKFNFF